MIEALPSLVHQYFCSILAFSFTEVIAVMKYFSARFEQLKVQHPMHIGPTKNAIFPVDILFNTGSLAFWVVQIDLFYLPSHHVFFHLTQQ